MDPQIPGVSDWVSLVSLSWRHREENGKYREDDWFNFVLVELEIPTGIFKRI